MNEPTASSNFGHQDTQPWYKNYMVIIFVIGLPLFVVVSCIWFVYYSVQIKDTVVRDDWYMDGKTLYQDVSRDKLAHDLGLHGEMLFSKMNTSNDYSIEFTLTHAQPLVESAVNYPDALTLSISHATDIDKDRDAILKHTTANKYTTTITDFDPLSSKYYVQVSNEGEQNWRLREVGELPQSRITFEPLKAFD